MVLVWCSSSAQMESVLLLCELVLLVVPLVSYSEDHNSARVGQNVTLPCQAPDGVNLEDGAVQWTRPDLDPDHYVFLYRDGRTDPDKQDPSFKDRVYLVHSQLEGADLSVVLKNVTKKDSGTYECYLFQNQPNKLKSDPDLIRTIDLMVSDPGSSGNKKQTGDKETGDEDTGDKQTGHKGGPEDRQRPGLIFGSVVVVVVVVVLVLSVGLLFFFRSRRTRRHRIQNPAEKQTPLV